MNKRLQISIAFGAAFCLGSVTELACSPLHLLRVVMAALVSKQGEESISTRVEKIKRAEEEEKLKAALKVAPLMTKAIQSERERELKNTLESPVSQNNRDREKFEEFKKRHPSYVPVLFPLSRGGHGYMGCDLDFNLGSRFSQILIQPGLRVLLFERLFGKNDQGNLGNIKLPDEAQALLEELTKNTHPGDYQASERDITTEIDVRHEITDDILSMASEIPAPHLYTETFVHKEVVKELEQTFSGSIKCTSDRCIVGNKRHVPAGLGVPGKDLPQAGRWFGRKPSNLQETVTPTKNSGWFWEWVSWLKCSR